MNLKQGSTQETLDTILENRNSTADRSAETVSVFLSAIEKQILNSIDYLDSDQAKKSMETDPYWPKWHSPWWHMTLLYELGLADRIPYRSLELFEKALDGYLHFFPFTEEEVPAGRDPIADVICQCALGTAHRVLMSANMAIDLKQPWIREWFVRYQLGDGGYNCDEAVYAAPNGKSSMISTVHIVESLLDLAANSGVGSADGTDLNGLTEAETECLDRSANYIIKRKLLRSLSKNDQIIDAQWTLLTFPRFYEIDILRTLRCVLRWSNLRNKQLPWNAVEEVVTLLNEKMDGRTSTRSVPSAQSPRLLHYLEVEREFYSSEKTRIRNADGSWEKGQAVSVFPLLLSTGREGQPTPILTQSWMDALNDLAELRKRDLLSFD